MILLLSLFIWWCRTDEACCDVEKPCLYRFGCKKHASENSDETNSDVSGSKLSLRSSKSATTLVQEDTVSVNKEELEATANNLEEIIDPKEEDDESETPDENEEEEEEKEEEETDE